jgi:hypothetical protein
MFNDKNKPPAMPNYYSTIAYVILFKSPPWQLLNRSPNTNVVRTQLHL